PAGPTPIRVAIRATIAGVVIVGAGGGLIKPMQTRWEGYLTKAELEAPRVRQQAQNAPSVMDQAMTALGKAQDAYDQTADQVPVAGASGGHGASRL
ncbi:MAG TPA: hypothetical protein VI110_12695, partial [Lapillicoccus sp.]